MDRRKFIESAACSGLGFVKVPAFPLPKSSLPERSWRSPTSTVDSPFQLAFDKGAIVSLKRKADAYETDYILEGQRFGDAIVRYRRPEGDWSLLSTARLAGANELSVYLDSSASAYEVEAEARDLSFRGTFTVVQEQLHWTIALSNRSAVPIEVGDVALPLPMNSDWTWDREVTYNQRVIRHSFISGNHSYIFCTRCNAVGPYLLMTPMGQTHLEYYDHSTSNETGRDIYTAYIHSRAQQQVIRKNGGRWRQPHTSTTLQPAGEQGDSWQAGFRLQWAADYEDIRRLLYENGLFNIHVTPGMTVPRGLPVKIALRNQHAIDRIEAEHPEQTAISHIETRHDDTHLFRIDFRRLGENKLTVRYGGGRHLFLEFFVSEPIETLLRKRAHFIVERQQIHNEDTWYDGLLSDWCMKDRVLLSPDDLHTIPESRRYMVSCDDPGLSRPAFLAAKNVAFPVQEEVDALDYYLRHFVWGGLQMTIDESHPCGVYGIQDWKRNRESSKQGADGQLHIWRIYDYPHVILMYLSMYRIARYHAGIEAKRSWQEYLQRAYRTTIAYYLYPLEVVDWSPYQTGNYNELVIVDLIDELEAAGWLLKARRVRKHWETKVAFFLSGKANLFGSEYPYDTTGFESTHAFARYAIEQAVRPEQEGLPLDTTRKEARQFMRRQIELNVGCRGRLEKAYYLYGSDYRGGGNAQYTLSYMSQMGGWSLLDYALYYAEEPHRYLRLAYASVLSSWALMNSGTEESNYGYWFPGRINDGGAGGGFEPLAYGRTWLEQPHRRGAWYYGCEIDLGYSGFLRAAATVLAEDPIFGLTAFGGTLEQRGDAVRVVPRDGLRRRFHVLRDDERFHLEVRYDRFAAEQPVVVEEGLSRLRFTLENVDGTAHTSTLHLSGLPRSRYTVHLDGQALTTVEAGDSKETAVELPITSPTHEVVLAREK